MLETINFVELNCGVCGSIFFVTHTFFTVREREDEEIYCPVGHAHTYTTINDGKKDDVKKLEAENADLKKRLFQAIHDAEQAEARKDYGDGSSLVEAKSPPEVKPVPSGDLPPIRHMKNRRCICPFCDIKPWSVHVRQHLRRHHGVSEEAIKNLKFEY